MNNQIKIFTVFAIISLFVNVLAQSTPDAFILEGNELHMLPDSGRSGYPIYISYAINNTQQFTSFQFDIILPTVLSYIEDSVWLFRKTNHFIIANLVNAQTLRILAYSPTNQPFTGNDGEIVRVKFDLNGSAGTYNVGLNNVVISNAIGTNILTGYFPGYIKIVSPDISGLTDVNFGETSVVDTLSYNYLLSNTGNDTLFITEFSSSESYFWNETSIPQNIPPGGSKNFNLRFHNIIKGQYFAIFTIRSNDPDEDPFYINTDALAFAPNYLLIENAEAFVGDTVTLKIDVNNYEPFYNFQVDIDFPDSLSFVTNSAVLTDRKQDHQIYEALLTPTKVRLFTYSLNNKTFLGNSGTVATLNFVVGNDTGTFPLNLSEAILTDSISQNIIRGTFDGEIHVMPVPTFPLTVDIANSWNIVSIPGKHPINQNINTWWAFRDPSASVFRYAAGYLEVTSVSPGKGYWMKHLGARTYNTGDEWPSGGIQVVKHYPLLASAGWNLIGGYELIVATSGITTNPPGLLTGQIYKYTNGYFPATTLVPGIGYWIKLAAPGYIILPEVMVKGSESTEFFPEDWGKIIITDAHGISYTLYAVNGSVDLSQYELPPTPMGGMYDFRYSSGRIAEDIISSGKTIEMSEVVYPLTVRVEGMDIRLMDETGKTLNVNLKAGEEVIIENSTIQKLMVTGELIPDKYALEQNYPNPFNPSTVIEFSLPEDVGNVKLSIYNALGEKVAELVNTSLQAGIYQYQWNAQNIATGIYIYELKTEKFVSIKKMLLLK